MDPSWKRVQSALSSAETTPIHNWVLHNWVGEGLKLLNLRALMDQLGEKQTHQPMMTHQQKLRRRIIYPWFLLIHKCTNFQQQFVHVAGASCKPDEDWHARTMRLSVSLPWFVPSLKTRKHWYPKISRYSCNNLTHHNWLSIWFAINLTHHNLQLLNRFSYQQQCQPVVVPPVAPSKIHVTPSDPWCWVILRLKTPHKWRDETLSIEHRNFLIMGR